MKSKITKIQILKKVMLLMLMLAILIPNSIYAVTGLTLQASTALEKLIYGEIGSAVRKIEEHFKSKTTLYIANEIQLRALAEYVNSGKNCMGKEIILLNNIEINENEDWIPIGTENKKFSGTFDGNNNTISKLKYINYNNYGYKNIGLFGVVAEEGIIKNVTVNNASIGNSNDKDLYSNVGNIVGLNYGKLIDCNANNVPLGITATQDGIGTEANKYIGKYIGRNEAGNDAITTTPADNILEDKEVKDGDGNVILTMTPKLYKNDEEIVNFAKTTYFNNTDKIKLEVTIDKYLFTGVTAGQEDKVDQINEVPKAVLGNNLVLNPLTPTSGDGKTVIGYELDLANISERISIDKVTIDLLKNKDAQNLYLWISEQESFNTASKLWENLQSYEVKLEDLNIVVDVTNPTVTTNAYVEDAIESGKYVEGTEIIITVTSSEKIKATVAPELNVKFSESGLGKYNYQGNNSRGNAVHVDSNIKSDGTTEWIYSYIIQAGDEGYLEVEYISSYVEMSGGTGIEVKTYLFGLLTDLAGNETDLNNVKQTINTIYADNTAPKATVVHDLVKDEEVNIGDANKDGKVNIKDATQIQKYLAGIIDENSINLKAADSNCDGKVNIKDATQIQKYLAGIIKESEISTKKNIAEVYYHIGWDELVEGFRKEDIIVNGGEIRSFSTISNEEDVDASDYELIITPKIEEGNEGLLQVIIPENVCTNSAGIGNVYAENIIKIDRRRPTVEIRANKNKVNKGEKITYEFLWSEAVKEFTKEDITVVNGTKETFTGEGNYYKLEVTPSGTNDVQVSVAENKCTDIAENSNIASVNHIIPVLPTVQIKRYRDLDPSEDTGDRNFDFNGDNKVDVMDYVVIQAYVANIFADNYDDLITQYNLKAFKDVNGDGEKDYKDLRDAVAQNGQNGQHGDINGDGNINVKDATDLEKILTYNIPIEIAIEEDIQDDELDKLYPLEGVTNYNEIYYVFEFSEQVEDFEAKDIIVNGGSIGEIELESGNTEIYNVPNSNKYIVKVKSSDIHKGNEGELQVILPENVCTDILGNGNTGSENAVKIDKKAPTVEIRSDKNKVNADETITYEFLWSESVKGFSKADITVSNGTKGTFSGEGNYYTLEVTPNSINDVEVSIEGNKCSDVAGNYNIASEKHIIPVHPTVKINPNTNGILNNLIKYTFEWSEKVEGFDISDITIKNGVLSRDSWNEVEPGLKYECNVTSFITDGNIGEIQVIIEEGVCKDVNGNNNIRREHTIMIDKIKPTLTSYSIKEESGKIIIETIFSEEIREIRELIPIMKIGGKEPRGEWNKTIFEDNKARFEYTIDAADGGKVEVSLEGKVTDISDNNSEEIKVNIDNDISLEQSIIRDDNGNEYTFKKNETSIIDFTNPTYFVSGDELTVTNVTENKTYSEIIDRPNNNALQMYWMKLIEPEGEETVGTIDITTSVNTNNVADYINITSANIYVDTVAPKVTTTMVAKNPKTNALYTIGDELIITATTSEKIQEGYITPVINVRFGGNAGKFNNGQAQFVEKAQTSDGRIVWTYRYVVSVGDEGEASLSYHSGTVRDLAGNEIQLTSLNSQGNIFTTNSITVDAIVPTVEIKVYKMEYDFSLNFGELLTPTTSYTSIMYEFIWSEPVTGFDISDIILPTGITGQFNSENNTLKVDYYSSIPDGNEGEVTIAVKENAVQDLNGNGNAYVSNTIKIDRIAPILISLESYTESNIRVNPNVDSVKQYYKAGEIVKVVATFSENVGNSIMPTLSLEFSESGNAKNNISSRIQGNKIIYTYEIDEEDKGTLSVKGFTGKVEDIAGNETIVTKRELVGYTVIADNTAPQLISIKAIAPNFEYDEFLTHGDTKRYGEGKVITIVAEYDQNVYHLESREIINITDSAMAPVLKLNFGDSEERTAEFVRVEGNKIYYEYTIQKTDSNEFNMRDNGDLNINSFTGTIYDIAGNNCTTGNIEEVEVKYYEESITEENEVNEIVADTWMEDISAIMTVKNYDDNGNEIKGNGTTYRKGAVITVVTTVNEYVYNRTDEGRLERFNETNATKLIMEMKEQQEGEAEKTATCKSVEYVDNKTIITYEYIITENDRDGEFRWEILEDSRFDIAYNTNYPRKMTAYGHFIDMTNPVTNWQSWVESEAYGIEDNGNGTWVVTFSEKLYLYNPDTHTVGAELSNSNKTSAPILLVSKDNNTELETTISSITTNSQGRTVITYTYTPYTKNLGSYGMKFANVSDKAGNIFNFRDISAPELQNIRVTSPGNGTYKEGEVITIVATFDEKLNESSQAPILHLAFRDSGDAKGNNGMASNGIINENEITYTYTITAYDNKGNGDNGQLFIKSFRGTGLLDLADNEWVAPNTVSLTGNRITADTISPVITKVEALVDDEVIGKYIVATKEYVTKQTNADAIKYVITFSEDINLKDEEAIELINAKKGNVTVDGNTITIESTPMAEGVQSLIIPANIVEDGVGNLCEEYLRFNGITTDFTKPTVRFISEYNGGIYVLPTGIGKIEIRANLEINEDISMIEYKWNDDKDYKEIEKYSGHSDIVVPTKEFTASGEHTLSIRVTDVAGNVAVANKEYTILDSGINITAKNEGIAESATNKLPPVNGDVIVTVEFEEGLTDNRKVFFKAQDSKEYRELNAEAEGYRITENGTVYAEATDKVGNKVFYLYGSEVGYPITNIDRKAPVIEFSEVPYGILKGEAIDIYISTDEVADIKYSWDNQNWLEYTDKLTHTFTEAGEHTLYAKATDSAGNESTAKLVIYVSELEFEVYGNTDYWTAGNVELEVSTESDIRKITLYKVTGEGENKEETKVEERTYSNDTPRNYIFTIEENGTYKFTVEDIYGNPSTSKDIVINKIDKAAPEITKVESVGNEIIITATDVGSGIEKYAISKTTENPEKWSESNKIKTTEDGTFYVWAIDNVGNIRRYSEPVVVDTVVLEIEVTGNAKDWTNQDIELTVKANKELSSLTMGETQIDLANSKVVIRENGTYEFTAVDKNGKTASKTVEVTKIDKTNPEITKVENNGREITVIATDVGSEIKEYAITTTTEVPVEWNKSDVIKTTEDGIFYAWVKDNAGNISIAATKDEAGNITITEVVIDTTAPIITFTYGSLTVLEGEEIVTNIGTNEDAIVSYSWDNKNWTNSEGYVSSLRVSKESPVLGKHTLYVKASDNAGNTSEIQTLEFNVIKAIADTKIPEIIFEDLPTIQVDGVQYVKVSSDMTTENITAKMNKEALSGKTPEYRKLTEDNKLRTGSEITIDGKTKYIIVVNGDVNCDGKVTLADVISANKIRINSNVKVHLFMAADYNLDGNITLADIVSINKNKASI